MQNKYAEVTPRNFNPMWAPGLSEEAREAVNAAFDAMSTWRIETAKNSEKNSEQVIEKMAAAAQALGWPEQVVDTIRAQMQSITKMQDPNDGSDDGRLGGADQITEPDCDAVEAKILARHQPDRQLAERKRLGDEPHAVLDAMGGAVAESLGRRDAPLLILA
jgi:hypothetical protein